MNILSRLIDRLNILSVRFDDSGGYAIALVPYIMKKGKPEAGERKNAADTEAVKEALVKAPVVIAVSGKGVVTKGISAENIVSTVTSDPGKFIWTVEDNSISFMRREQLVGLLRELESAGIVAFSVECLPDDSMDNLSAIADRLYSEKLRWKRVLKPSAEGSQLALLIAKRIRLPVLGIVLLMLAANFAVSPKVSEGFASANAELNALRKSTSTAASANDRRKAAIEQFSNRLPYRFSWLADRIGSCVPEKSMLGQLAIFPLVKNVETGKPIQQRERIVVISGETPDPESIASFVRSLGELGVGTVKLASVEQDRDRSVQTFTIEIEL